jgi:phosphatidylglycerophosphatase A
MNDNKLSAKVWQNPVYFIAFGFGSGLMPKAPGTWGTVMAIPIYLLIAGTPWWMYLSIVALAFILGVYVSQKVSKELGVHDHSGIVWDEIVGYLLTMFLLPTTWLWMVGGFILFRLFDILKPEPIRTIDKQVKGGMGIMLDDVLAAIMAWIPLQLIVWGLA